MEAAGMQLPGRRRRRRRKARAGEVESPNKEVNDEEEEEGDEEEELEEEEQEQEQEEEEPRNLDSVDYGKESDQGLDHNLQAQVLQLLDELEETREMVLKHEEDALELQAQMRSRKDEFDSLQETKEVELERVEQELQEANEEIHSLRLDAEEVAAVHENEIAGLQEELCRLKAELQRVQQVRDEYDMELTALRAEIRMKQELFTRGRTVVGEAHDEEEQLSNTSLEVAKLQGELTSLSTQYLDLKEEFQTLQASNKVMVHQLEKLEALKYKFRNRYEDTPSMESISQWPSDRRFSIIKPPTTQKGSSVSFWSVEIVGVASDYNNEERMEKVDEENEQDHQLEVEEKVEMVQTQGNISQCNLPEMENEDHPCYQELDVRRRQRRRRYSEKGGEEDGRTGNVSQWSLPEMENEDHPCYQELDVRRRQRRRRYSEKGGEEDGRTVGSKGVSLTKSGAEAQVGREGRAGEFNSGERSAQPHPSWFLGLI
ncbi:coiled-coil domain-containing protein 136 isoform 2-T2 [Liasis olivaceus]